MTVKPWWQKAKEGTLADFLKQAEPQIVQGENIPSQEKVNTLISKEDESVATSRMLDQMRKLNDIDLTPVAGSAPVPIKAGTNNYGSYTPEELAELNK